MSTITDLIAKHHPVRDEAIRLIAAVELVIDAASSYADDLETGLKQGIYEETECGAEHKALVAALELIDAA
jgi:hypothetical protein